MRFPGFVRDRTSIVGGILALLAAEAIVVLVVIDLTYPQSNPYVGIYTYLVLPAVLLLGLVLLAISALTHRSRRKRRPEMIYAPVRLDLENPRHRRVLLGVVASTLLLLVLLSGLGMRSYEFTDSATFCGEVCHQVMEPQYTTYRNSPHARVRCVGCHVGPGASWYVRSKLSGARQVLAVTFHTYPRPIPSPIKDLRPAQDTCEQCHWPEKFHGMQLKLFAHYADDRANTDRHYQLLLRTGGGDPHQGSASGIHWHVNIANQVSYIARDRRRQDIPWVQTRDRSGATKIYASSANPLSAEEITAATPRRMDCMDCHNRPTHIFPSPRASVNESLFMGRLDVSVPFIRARAVEALEGDYPTKEAARQAIASTLEASYREGNPDLYVARGGEIAAAVAEVQRIYRSTIFPYMRVDWKTYPTNIGHMAFPGCFRCHDGQHVTETGEVLSRDCQACHVILAADSPLALAASAKGTPAEKSAFQHPVDLGLDPAEMNCPECHGPQ